MSPRRASRVAALAAVAFAALAGCGKKAPLRLPDQIKAEPAAALQASVRAGIVSLRFRVPARRMFPEREEPWVLARILRREGGAAEFTEVGTILDPAGLPFEAGLSWDDPGRAAGPPLVYAVEFRDARRLRRARTPELAIAWSAVPGAPLAMTASGAAGAVSLGWDPPAGAMDGLRYRVYRREGAGEPAALPGAEVATPAFVDSRVDAGREYCYRVRAFLAGTGVEVEGPAGDEACARATATPPPPAPGGLTVRALGRSFELRWEGVGTGGEIAGYVVYRSAGAGPLERRTARPVAGEVYIDDAGDLAPGTVVRWAVTAVERSARGAESAMSAPASATVPAP